ncbi:hypothetical protein [Limnovirga soli]|uniref:Uncharacterized protein n=1 Tax=Limnovirga soli TaxID=2656915 RepID=A0A8J8FI83_9BACT|nr:hypothetical protein [Limnovirga soli]NNV57683.1 hypothetical protein [Limnovirga soli]
MMTKVSGFIFGVCFIFSSACGQAPNFILTSDQNNKWIDSLKTLPLEQQLAAINIRLLIDTNIYVRQFYNDRIRISDSLGNRVYGDGKPSLVVGGYFMIIDNGTKNGQIIKLTKLLTAHYIKEVGLLSSNNPKTLALYGTKGLHGIIFLTMTKKKYLRKFQRLNLKSNGYRYT